MAPFPAFKEGAQTPFLRTHLGFMVSKYRSRFHGKNRSKSEKVGRTREMVKKTLATVAAPLGHPCLNAGGSDDTAKKDYSRNALGNISERAEASKEKGREGSGPDVLFHK